MAIRQNSANAWDGNRDVALYQMKKGVLAVLWHCTGFESLTTRHQFCPRSKESWCSYWQRDGKEPLSSSVNLPQAIHDVILPIFQDLRADDLLSRCLDGTSQNPNEAFNQIMWKKCPKDTFIARKVLEIGAASAIINFNDGVCGFLKLYRNINIEFGGMTITGAVNKDKLRVLTIWTENLKTV